MSRTIYLKGILCSCHGTEHHITTNEATLRAALGEEEERHVCFVCRHSIVELELNHWGRGLWQCRDATQCAIREKQIEARRKLATEQLT